MWGFELINLITDETAKMSLRFDLKMSVSNLWYWFHLVHMYMYKTGIISHPKFNTLFTEGLSDACYLSWKLQYVHRRFFSKSVCNVNSDNDYGN